MYNYRTEVNGGFEVLSSETANHFRNAIGHIGQLGIRYPENMPNTVVFSSNSAYDIIDAMKNKFWDHTGKSIQVKEGFTVYIVTNQKQAKAMNSLLVIKGVATSVAYEVETGNASAWTSSFLNDTDALLDVAVEVEDNALTV